MKLTFEIQGYNITIEETEEGVVVTAMQDDEEVESFTLNMDGQDDTDDDFDGEDGMDDLDDVDGSQELPEPEEGMSDVPGSEDEFAGPGGEGKLESFMSFIRKRN